MSLSPCRRARMFRVSAFQWRVGGMMNPAGDSTFVFGDDLTINRPLRPFSLNSLRNRFDGLVDAHHDGKNGRPEGQILLDGPRWCQK